MVVKQGYKSRIVKICSNDTLVSTYKRLEYKLQKEELTIGESIIRGLIQDELISRKIDVYALSS